MLNNFADARRYFLQTQKLKPNCPSIAEHLQKLTVAEKKYAAQEKFMIKRMFGLSNEKKGSNADAEKHVTSDVTDLDSIEELQGVPEGEVCGQIAKPESSNACSKTIKPEIVDIILSELERLTTSDPPLKSVVFPSNLSADELTFLGVTAADHGCELHFVERGVERLPKVVRPDDRQ